MNFFSGLSSLGILLLIFTFNNKGYRFIDYRCLANPPSRRSPEDMITVSMFLAHASENLLGRGCNIGGDLMLHKHRKTFLAKASLEQRALDRVHASKC